MTMIPWKNGKPLVWDVTCVDTLALSNIGFSLEGTGEAAKQGETRKKKYVDLSNQFEFVPFAVETFGSFGPDALRLLKSILLLLTSFALAAGE